MVVTRLRHDGEAAVIIGDVGNAGRFSQARKDGKSLHPELARKQHAPELGVDGSGKSQAYRQGRPSAWPGDL